MTTAPAPRVLLASHNPHKLDELRDIVAPLLTALEPSAIQSATDVDAPEPVEDGATFADNALIKARALAGATGLPCIADDSGLIVDLMGAAPGVLSARWAGEHGNDTANVALLLAQLADVPDDQRGARFVTAAALVIPGNTSEDPAVEIVEHGEMPGRIIREPRGNNGFGYDPIFIAEGQERTSAELTREEKNAISHRGAALRKLAAHLDRLGGR